MKKIFLNILLLGTIVVLSNCGGDNPVEPTEAEKRTAILVSGNGTWTPPTTEGVLLEGTGGSTTDISELFENFTIKFTATGFTTTGTTPVWPRSGTWAFKDATGTVFTRGDGIEVTVTEITAETLEVTMEWDETIYARTGAYAGKHIFTFNK